jgi:hypothetical protein
MNDLATSWISPFWQTTKFGASGDWHQSTVYVVNPGPNQRPSRFGGWRGPEE